MTKREEIKTKIKQNIETLSEIERLNIELQKELYLLCDEKQWFEEKDEIIVKKVGRKTIEEKKVVGRIHWVEHFKDEDIGVNVPIKRSQIVKVGGIWCSKLFTNKIYGSIT